MTEEDVVHKVTRRLQGYPEKILFRTRTVVDADHYTFQCGLCKKRIYRGQTLYYFHREESEFCSEKCLQAYYKDDTEAYEISADRERFERMD